SRKIKRAIGGKSFRCHSLVQQSNDIFAVLDDLLSAQHEFLQERECNLPRQNSAGSRFGQCPPALLVRSEFTPLPSRNQSEWGRFSSAWPRPSNTCFRRARWRRARLFRPVRGRERGSGFRVWSTR